MFPSQPSENFLSSVKYVTSDLETAQPSPERRWGKTRFRRQAIQIMELWGSTSLGKWGS